MLELRVPSRLDVMCADLTAKRLSGNVYTSTRKHVSEKTLSRYSTAPE